MSPSPHLCRPRLRAEAGWKEERTRPAPHSPGTRGRCALMGVPGGCLPWTPLVLLVPQTWILIWALHLLSV